MTATSHEPVAAVTEPPDSHDIPGTAAAARMLAADMIKERRRTLVGYTIGIVALVGLMVLVYPSIRTTGEELDAYAESLPQGLQEAFGLAASSIASPEGYLMSQLYSNMFPIVLVVLGIALGAWAIAGSEGDGTLEMVLANPLTRTAVTIGRSTAMWLIVALVTIAGTATLAVTSPFVGLDDGLPWWGIWSAGVASYALVMMHSAIAFAVGAATGNRGAAIAAATVVLVAGFAAQLVGSAAESLHWLRDLSPWYWLIDANPLTHAPGVLDTLVPLVIAVALTAVGGGLFYRRDVSV